MLVHTGRQNLKTANRSFLSRISQTDAFDLLYGNSTDNENLADFDAVIEEDESVTEDQRKIVQLLRDGPMAPKELQEASSYQSREAS